jgi:regulator of protease activity HflC (stomatin/prohibitin superfamily)
MARRYSQHNPLRTALLCAAALPLSLATQACTQIPTGEVGVVTYYGRADHAAQPGFVWYNPWSTDINVMDVRTQPLDGKTEAYTKDVQKAVVQYKLTYHLYPPAALRVFSTAGTDWANVQVPQVVDQAIKDVFGRSEAVRDAINNRAGVQANILSDLRHRLRTRYVVVDGFELRDISFSQAFEHAVEQKQVAVENANAARNRTAQVQEEANQKIIAAKADAEAMQIKSAALSGNPGLTAYEAAMRWDGHMPTYMLGSGGANPGVLFQVPGGR